MPDTTPDRHALLRAGSALAAWFGITRALVFSVLGRTWSVVAGPVTLVCIGRFLTRDEQGFYYTFWSVLGLWVFFDLGLGLVIVQFASHERAALRVIDGRIEGSDAAKERLASLFHLAMRWYGGAGILMTVVVVPVGIVFFNRYHGTATEVHWLGAWVLVGITSTINMLIGPLTSILEGSGLLQDVALMRLLQAMTANACLWIALFAGARLYSAAVLNGMMAAFAIVWLAAKHRRFFLQLRSIRATQNRIRWREEIWPFQWRFAVSWMTGYFMFQVLNPILFANAGPAVAGQMGMTLMVTTAIALFAQAWITTRGVDYGAWVASRNFALLDRTFRATLVQSTVVIVGLSIGFMTAVEILRRLRHPLAGRLLPPLPLSLLIAATILNHIVSTEASYLRAFKREPFLAVFVPMCAVTVVGSLLLAPKFGAVGMTAVLLAAVAFIGVAGGTMLFVVKRRRWVQAEALDEAVVVEFLK